MSDAAVLGIVSNDNLCLVLVTIQPTTRVVLMAMPRKHGEGEPYHLTSRHVHITIFVNVRGVLLPPRVKFDFHRSGMIYGSLPNNEESRIRVASSVRRGWLNKDPEWKLYVLEDGDKTVISHGPGL